MTLPEQPIPLEVEVWVKLVTNPWVGALVLGLPLGFVLFLGIQMFAPGAFAPIWVDAIVAWVAASGVMFVELTKPY